MIPTQNDVLSGRGARCNRHPGNEYFRRIVEQQKTMYKTGTKKQKMIISKAIVEAIHSNQPPGRFLKKCADTGQWEELSERQATDKAAQAMSYAINGESLKLKRKKLQLLRLFPSSQQPQDDNVDVSAASSLSQRADRPREVKSHPTSNDHLIDNESSSVAATYRGLADDGLERVNVQLLSGNSNIQQQLTQLQLQRQRQFSSNTNTSPPLISGVNPPSDRDGSVPIQSQMLQLQQQQLPLPNTFGNCPTSLPHTSLEFTRMLNQAQQLHQQQQLLLQHQHGLIQHNMIQPSLLTSLPASLPSSLSSSAPTLSAPFFSNQGASLLNGGYFSGSQDVTNNLLQNLVMQQPQLNQSDVRMHSMLGNNLQNQSKNDGRATASQEVELLLQCQRQSQFSARSEPSMFDLLRQQQLQQPRSFPFPLHQQTSQLQQNLQDPQTTSTNEPSPSK